MSRYSGRHYRGASRDARVQRRQEAAERQAAYVELLSNGPDEVRRYRNKNIRPRLGRKMREDVAA